MSVKERIIKYVDYLGISVRAFEMNCGLSNGLVNNIRESLAQKTLDKVSMSYPELNIGWLLTGEGPMLKEPNQLNTMDATKEADLLRSEIEILKKSNEEKERTIQRLFEQFDKLSEQNQVLVSLVTNTSVPKKKEAI